jgi:O-antigen/teichoic acid export membrane protein
MLNFDIRGILILLIGARLLSASMYFILCIKVFPVLKNGIILDMNRIRSMIKYGGWVSISNVLNPILNYLDRILIGSMLSLAYVAYYTAPYEMISRLSILPASLVMTLFPSFSAASILERTKMTGLYARSVRLLLIVMPPIIAGFIVFAGNIINVWLGEAFAAKSTIVFQLLAFGIFINAMAYIPSALIQGFGRPDITAKFHLLELFIYIPLAVVLIRIFGIAGGALAWTLRVSIDAVLLYAASGKYVDIEAVLDSRLRQISLTILLLAVSMGIIMLLKSNVIVKLMLSMVVFGMYGMLSWFYCLNIEDKKILGSTINISV